MIAFIIHNVSDLSNTNLSQRKPIHVSLLAVVRIRGERGKTTYKDEPTIQTKNKTWANI